MAAFNDRARFMRAKFRDGILGGEPLAALELLLEYIAYDDLDRALVALESQTDPEAIERRRDMAPCRTCGHLNAHSATWCLECGAVAKAEPKAEATA